MSLKEEILKLIDLKMQLERTSGSCKVLNIKKR